MPVEYVREIRGMPRRRRVRCITRADSRQHIRDRLRLAGRGQRRLVELLGDAVRDVVFHRPEWRQHATESRPQAVSGETRIVAELRDGRADLARVEEQERL